MKPVKLRVYNSIVRDVRNFRGYGRKQELELLKKYNNLPNSTVSSIFSLLVQRLMKYNYRKSLSISQKYYNHYQELKKTESLGTIIIKLAERYSITPSLFARSLLQHLYSDLDVMELIKDTSLIREADLAYEVFVANLNDNQYGPYADTVKRSIGIEYEYKLEEEVKKLNIKYTHEHRLRGHGFDKTPDIKLTIPIAVNGFIIHWIESKAMFGDVENHFDYLTDQFNCYWNRFGPGLIIYWYGFLETLQYTDGYNTKFILRSSFPKKEDVVILQYKD